MAFTWRPYRVIGDVNHNGGGANRGEDRSSAVRALRWQSDPFSFCTMAIGIQSV
jgi:hypothetical protein